MQAARRRPSARRFEPRGAYHQRARLDAVDAVARDGEDVAAVRHHVAQDGQVAVVDVRAVELDDGAQLAEQRVAHRLDAEHADDLDDVVGGGARVVDAPVGAHDRLQVDALRVEEPLVVAHRRAGVGVDALEPGLAHEDAADALDAAQRHLGEHRRLDLLQEDVVRLSS